MSVGLGWSARLRVVCSTWDVTWAMPTAVRPPSCAKQQQCAAGRRVGQEERGGARGQATATPHAAPPAPATHHARGVPRSSGRSPSGKTERPCARGAPSVPARCTCCPAPSAKSSDRRHQAILQARGATRRTRTREHAGSRGVALWAARGDEVMLGVMRGAMLGVASVRAARPFSGAWSLRPPTRSSATRRRSWRRWP